MRTSKRGLAFVAREEGLVLHPYNDSEGHATIGVGHLLHRGPVTAADRARWAHFTRAQALGLLERDIAVAERAVRQVRVKLNRNEFDALVSLTFNIGVGGFLGSTVKRRLDEGDRRGAANAILMWRIPAVLLPRRRRERALFLTPVRKRGKAALTTVERAWLREYEGLENRDTPEEGDRWRRLHAILVKRRKAIWHNAQHDGWDKNDRRERYRVLAEATRPKA